MAQGEGLGVAKGKELGGVGSGGRDQGGDGFRGRGYA